MDIGRFRKEFTRMGLQRKSLNDNPYKQFEKWFQDALKSQIPELNAFSLATVSGTGIPSIRTVLLKYFDESGFVFYTNYGSKKAHDIKENSNVAMLFPWLPLERQIKIIGRAEKVSTKQSVKYFTSRPKGSQIGAWVSQQSSVITSRKLLMQKFEEMLTKYKNKKIPLPDFWGGYKIIPTEFEFWQGRENRLHDRFSYSLDKNGKWIINRLAP